MHPDWKNLLRSVGILIGKSQNSVEGADAFLWNMISLEQLLLLDKERQGHVDLLVLRIKALLGYCPFWVKNQMEKRVRELYRLRCRLVHEGCRNGVDIHTVIATDELLRNIMTAIMHNRKHFTSKTDIIEFAEKAKARDLLGIPARPKAWKFAYWRLDYTESDIQKHWKL